MHHFSGADFLTKFFFSVLFKGKSDEQLENEKIWLDCERLWLMHKSGFTAVRLMSRSHESGKVGICLEATGEQATVDEDDVELVRDDCVR